jgi:hypothetical protein
LNVNYATIVKQNIYKLLAVGYIKLVEEAIWLSSIVVVLEKNGKLRSCVDFRKLNVETKKILTCCLLWMRFIPFGWIFKIS